MLKKPFKSIMEWGNETLISVLTPHSGADPDNFSKGGGPTLSKIDSV